MKRLELLEEQVNSILAIGAGKSSISMALWRILPLSSGSILIDGLDISTIGLDDLRSRLTIIPQDPVLFEGSLRSNLDPLQEHTDERIWEALNQTGLLQSIQTSSSESELVSQKMSLESSVQQDGRNYSQGQRQLLCLARALLRSSKFIFLDEATASVDTATDEKIQHTIRNFFNKGTVLTIAHRLKTVIDYDRILVLQAGEVIEFDTPYNLLLEKGAFYQMALDSGNYDELVSITSVVGGVLMTAKK